MAGETAQQADFIGALAGAESQPTAIGGGLTAALARLSPTEVLEVAREALERGPDTGGMWDELSRRLLLAFQWFRP